MKKSRSRCFMVVMFAVFFIFTLSAHAELLVRGTDSVGNQLIYDSDLDITWYDFTKTGAEWQNQVNWADALDVDFGGTLYTDWRLPSTPQPDSSCGSQFDPGGGFPLQGYGYNCTGSEMGYLYSTELGNPAAGPPNNFGVFQNLMATWYWTGVEYAANTDGAYVFIFAYGIQSAHDKRYDYYAMAVRDGDVTVVPEPISFILFITGGTLLAGRYLLRKA